MSNLLEEIAIAAQKMKKDRFPDHVCAQANRIMCHAGSICENADIIKYRSNGDTKGNQYYLKQWPEAENIVVYFDTHQSLPQSKLTDHVNYYL